MTRETTAKPRSFLRKVARVLGILILLVIVGLAVAHFAWKYSGSNEWVKVSDKEGIQVYTLKEPGSTLKDFKAVTRVKTTLNRAAAAMLSTETADCAEWAPSCRSEKEIQPWNPKEMTYVHLYRMNYPKPFMPREFLLKAKVSQNPANKALLVEFIALPDALPKNDCCFRLEELHNRWQFTPVGNGEVEVELRTDMDQGIPYFMINNKTPFFLHKMFKPLQKWYDKDKWETARYEGIVEP